MDQSHSERILAFNRALKELTGQAKSIENDHSAVKTALNSDDPRTVKDAILLKQGLEFRREVFEQNSARLKTMGLTLEQDLDQALAKQTFKNLHIDTVNTKTHPATLPFISLIKHQDGIIRHQQSLIRHVQEVNLVLENELARLRKDLLSVANNNSSTADASALLQDKSAYSQLFGG